MDSSVARSRRRKPAKQLGTGRLFQLAQDVGGTVDRHGGEQLARLGAWQRLHEFGRAVEFRLVEDLDQTFERHFTEQFRRVLSRLPVEGFDNVGDVIVG